MNITKKTKIVCTIGPSSDTYERCLELYNAGMNVMRINFSHGSYEEHLKKIEISQRLYKEEGIIIPIMLDTKGPEIRTHCFKDGVAHFDTDQEVRISMTEVLGTTEKFSVTYSDLFNDVEVGHHIKLDDGYLDMIVTKKDYENNEIVCRALNHHTVKDRRGVNCPETEIQMPYISEKDFNDITWGTQHDVTFIAASFVRTKEDVLAIRKILLDNNRPDMRIISKIENPQA